MFDLGTAANVAEILGAATVLGAAVFAVVELREMRHSRRQQTAWDTINSTHTWEYHRAIRVLMDLPEGWAEEPFSDLSDEQRVAVLRVYQQVENLGVLVHEGIVGLDIAVRAYGTGVKGVWRTLQPFIERNREQEPLFGAHFEWLIGEIERREEDIELPSGEAPRVSRPWNPG